MLATGLPPSEATVSALNHDLAVRSRKQMPATPGPLEQVVAVFEALTEGKQGTRAHKLLLVLAGRATSRGYGQGHLSPL